MKKILVIIVLILIIIGLGKTSQEVRDRAFIQSVAIQNDENNIYTTVKLYDDITLYKGIGDNIETSLASAETRQGKMFFTGHTEVIIFSKDSFSITILQKILDTERVSPNCAVIISENNVEDTETAFNILKTYDRIGQVPIKTASNIIKTINKNQSIEIPFLNEDFTYITITIK